MTSSWLWKPLEIVNCIRKAQSCPGRCFCCRTNISTPPIGDHDVLDMSWLMPYSLLSTPESPHIARGWVYKRLSGDAPFNAVHTYISTTMSRNTTDDQFKKTHQTVSRPEVTSHNLNDEFFNKPPQVCYNIPFCFVVFFDSSGSIEYWYWNWNPYTWANQSLHKGTQRYGWKLG